jgi:glutamate racemase
LCATEATVQSGIYQSAFRMIGKHIEALAIPELAGAVEFGAPQEKIEETVADAFRDIPLRDFDVLILGCTHYPLAIDVFKKVVPASLALFDPALAVAARVEKQFWPQEAGEGKTTFLISKDSPPFRAFAEKLFPDARATIEVLE